MTLAGVYGFWKYVSKLDRRETRRYLEMFYILKLRELVYYYLDGEIQGSSHISQAYFFIVFQVKSVPLAVEDHH